MDNEAAAGNKTAADNEAAPDNNAAGCSNASTNGNGNETAADNVVNNLPNLVIAEEGDYVDEAVEGQADVPCGRVRRHQAIFQRD